MSYKKHKWFSPFRKTASLLNRKVFNRMDQGIEDAHKRIDEIPEGIAEWQPDTTYEEGAFVVHEGNLYQALEGTDSEPGGVEWKQYMAVEEYDSEKQYPIGSIVTDSNLTVGQIYINNSFADVGQNPEEYSDIWSLIGPVYVERYDNSGRPIYAFTNEGQEILSSFGQQEVYNKRIIPRVQSQATGNISPTNDYDVYIRTGLSGSFTINNPSGTFSVGERLTFTIRNAGGGSNSISWGNQYNLVTGVFYTGTRSTEYVTYTFEYNGVEWRLVNFNTNVIGLGHGVNNIIGRSNNGIARVTIPDYEDHVDFSSSIVSEAYGSGIGRTYVPKLEGEELFGDKIPAHQHYGTDGEGNKGWHPDVIIRESDTIIAAPGGYTADSDRSVVLGAQAYSDGSPESLALGFGAAVENQRAIAIGSESFVATPDVAVIATKDLRLVPHHAAGTQASTLTLMSPNGTAFTVSVDNSGNLSVDEVM